jgi:hypothetical protein
MNKKLVAVGFLLCLACFVVIQTARAQTVTPGVKAGDDFTFTTFSYWTSSSALDSIPQDLITANQTTSIDVRISSANDTYITTFTASYFTSGAPQAARGTVNIQTGNITDGGFAAIIGANLNQGDLIHPLGTDAITINDTVTMNGRPTNEIIINLYNSTNGVTLSDDRFFDQATGMLVQETQKSVDDGTVSGDASTSSLTLQLKYSPWNPEPVVTTPEFPPALALSIIVGATTLVVIGLKKKHLILTPVVKA